MDRVEVVSFLMPRLHLVPDADTSRFALGATPLPSFPCLSFRWRRFLFKLPVVRGGRQHDARCDPYGVLASGELHDSRRTLRHRPATIVHAVDQNQEVPVALDDRARLQLLARGFKLPSHGFGELDLRFRFAHASATPFQSRVTDQDPP